MACSRLWRERGGLEHHDIAAVLPKSRPSTGTPTWRSVMKFLVDLWTEYGAILRPVAPLRCTHTRGVKGWLMKLHVGAGPDLHNYS